MPAARPRRSTRSPRRVLRAVLIGLALVPALAITAYLATNLAGVVAAQNARDRVADAVTERLADEVPGVEERSAASTARVAAEPAHRWVAQACRFETVDSGWIVQSHREVCVAEAVVVWPVDSEQRAEELVEGLRPPGRSPYRSGSCLSFGVDGDLFGRHQQFLYVAPGGDRAARWCVPAGLSGTARRAVVGEVVDPDPQQGWLLLVTVEPLVDEDIGCQRWSVVFCDNPFGGEVAWGDAPG